MKKTFISLLLVFFSLIPMVTFGQSCSEVATSITTQLLSHERCPSAGALEVSSVVPAPNDLNSGSYYEYALENSDSLVANWQLSTIFPNLKAGSYRVKVRVVCASNIGTEFVQPTYLTINTQLNPANMNSVTVERRPRCNDGQIRAVGLGRPPLTYALVNALSAPNTAASRLTPIQDSGVFSALAAGTYYVRVWDSCGGYATSQISVAQESRNVQFSASSIIRYNCDSFVLRDTLKNMFRFPARFAADTSTRAWVVWPNGVTDTIALSVSDSLNKILVLPFQMSHISNSVNPSLLFPANITGWPKTMVLGYKNACGTVVTRNVVYNPSSLAINLASPIGGVDPCGLERYYLSLTHNTLPADSFGVYLNSNMAYSLDGGANWERFTLDPNFYDSRELIYLTRGVTNEIIVAYCGDTVTRSVFSPLVPFGAEDVLSVDDLGNVVCSGDLIVTNVANTILGGTFFTVEIVSGPIGFTLPPYVRVRSSQNTLVYSNLPIGDYRIRVADTVGGAFCGIEEFDLTIEPRFEVGLMPYNMEACDGNSGFFWQIVGWAQVNSYGRPVKVEVLEQPSSNPLPSEFFTNAFTASSNNKREPYFTNLPKGRYKFFLTDSIAPGCVRTRMIERDIAEVNVLRNNFNVDILCNNEIRMELNQVLNNGLGTLGQTVGNRFNIEVYEDATNTIVYSLNVPASVSGFIHNYSVPPAISNAWSGGPVYRIHTYFNIDGASSINDSCSVRDFYWTKGTPLFDLSGSIFVNGCDADSAEAIIIAKGISSVPRTFTWDLYKITPTDTVLVAGPTQNTVFTNLEANAPYILAASDGCGFGQSIAKSSSAYLRLFASSVSDKMCPGDDIYFSVDDIDGAVYTWYKDNVVIPLADDHFLQINNLDPLEDEGVYRVEADVASECNLFSNSFTVVVDCRSLPIQFGDFSVKANDNYVTLFWNTHAEKYSRGFYIERSINGIQWDVLGFVNSLAQDGSSSINLSYDFVDKAPSAGLNFYRLKQVDFDGQSDYSAVREAWFGGIKSAISIYPNPSTTYVNIKGLLGDEVLVIYDVMGREVLRQQATGFLTTVSLAKLNDGTYTIRIQGKNDAQTFPLIKMGK